MPLVCAAAVKLEKKLVAKLFPRDQDLHPREQPAGLLSSAVGGGVGEQGEHRDG